MATASSSDDQFICPVCLSEFDRPRSLPCLHTFCTACLRAHIDTNAQRSVFLSFPCPVCRAETKPPRPFTTHDKWTDQFPVNYWILSAIEDRESRDREAVLYCEHHPDMKITLFCSDHERLCCAMCVATAHRKCDDVVDTDTVVETRGVRREKEAVTQIVTELQCRVNEVAEQTAVAQERLGSKRASIDNVIQENVDIAVTNIQAAENNLLLEIGNLFDGISVNIDVNKKFIEKGMIVCDEISELLNDVNENEPLKHDFIRLLKAREKLSDMKSTETCEDETLALDNLQVEISDELRHLHNVTVIGKIKRSRNDDYDNTKDKKAQENTETEQTTCIGSSEIGGQQQTSQAVNPSVQLSVDSHFHFVNMLHTATSQSGLSWITAGVPMKSKSLVLCDHKSSSIKLMKDGNLLFELKTLKPWGVACLSNSQVAVSNPTERVIQLYDVKSDVTSVKARILRKFAFLGQPIRPNNNFSTRDACFGICFTGSLVVAACEDCIQTYSPAGRLIQQIDQYDDNNDNFRRVISVAYCYIKSVVYACDEVRNRILAFGVQAMNIRNQTRFVYTHPELRCPQGVATGSTGEVYVTGFVSRNVHVISPEGESLRIVGVGQQPWAVCLDTRRNRLLLSFYPDHGSNGACSVYDLRQDN